MMTRLAPLLVATALLLAPSVSAQPPAALAIIVHRSNPIESLTVAELREVVLLERQSWPTHKRITVAMRDRGQVERTSLLRAVCRMSDGDFSKHVLQMVFRGMATSEPRTLSTAEGMRRFVFNVPSALGYLRAGDVDDSVKVLRVEGKLPGDAGYPLTVPGPSASGSASR